MSAGVVRAVAMGDSQTEPTNGWTRPARMWPFRHQAMLETLFEAAGSTKEIAMTNLGVSGDTSLQMLARAHSMFRWGPPDIAYIYGFPNDPGASINAAGTQTNLQGLIKSLKHGAYGSWAAAGAGRAKIPVGPAYVADPTALPANGKFGQRIVALATGGVTLSGAAAEPALVSAGLQADNVGGPTTASGNSGQTVWEYRNPQAGIAGWGCVVNNDHAAPHATRGCKRIIVINTNYLYWTTGGDTVGTPYAAYASVRSGTAAAVAAEAVGSGTAAVVIPVDLYGYQKNLVQNQSSTYPTNAWHTVADNQHHNELGNLLVARAPLDPTYGIPPATLTQIITDLK